MVRNPALCAWIIKAAFNNKHMHVYVYAPLLSRFSRVRLSNPMDHSPLGFSVPGIFQARILGWVAISFCCHLWISFFFFKSLYAVYIFLFHLQYY